MLKTAGLSINPKRVERIWRREGLKVPSKQLKRGRLWLNDGHLKSHVGHPRRSGASQIMDAPGGARQTESLRPASGRPYCRSKCKAFGFLRPRRESSVQFVPTVMGYIVKLTRDITCHAAARS